jgi:hypothetical protein
MTFESWKKGGSRKNGDTIEGRRKKSEQRGWVVRCSRAKSLGKG